ncbi:MAG: hypothetical protein J6B01_04395 [Ruminococcus sp.]|nr:hypothetical protein [Ruminococcus sp.]
MIKDLLKALIVVLILAGIAFVLNGCGQKTEKVSTSVNAGVIAELDGYLADVME